MPSRESYFHKAEKLKGSVVNNYDPLDTIQDGEVMEWLINEAKGMNEIEISLKGTKGSRFVVYLNGIKLASFFLFENAIDFIEDIRSYNQDRKIVLD